MVGVPASKLSAGLVHLCKAGTFPPLAEGLVQAQISLVSQQYEDQMLLPSSLDPALAEGTRAALLLAQKHRLALDLTAIQAARWLHLVSADLAPLALEVAQLAPLAPAAGQVEAYLSSADGSPRSTRRSLRALSALLWACPAGPVHPLLPVLGESRTVALMAHVARLYRLALQQGELEGLALAWDALDATLLLTERGGTVPPTVLEVSAEVREDAHAVQHALCDPAAPQGGLVRFTPLAHTVRRSLLPPAQPDLPQAPPSPPPPPNPLVERRNVFSDADLLRAQRVRRDAPLAALDEETKKSIVARGLAESSDEEEGGTLGVFANPFGAPEPAEADGDSSDEDAAVPAPRGDPTEMEDEPTGIYRRQRVVRGSNPRGVNDWRTRAEDWEVSSSDEGDLPGPKAPIASSSRPGQDPSAPASAPASGSASARPAGGVQLGDERILLAAYAAPGGEKDLTKAGRGSKARTHLKNALGGRWDDHQIESWTSMLQRNPRKDNLLGPFKRTGLPAGGNPNLRAGPASAAGGGASASADGDKKGGGKDEKRPLNQHERRNKERRGNVARQRGADRKAARTGMFPTE